MQLGRPITDVAADKPFLEFIILCRLNDQKGIFLDEMQVFVKANWPELQLSKDEEDPVSEQATTKQAPTAKEFWEEACCLGARLRYPEWVKLAELVMVLVPGSVEDERMFSAMKYLKNH
jgi:hypothetical protein